MTVTDQFGCPGTGTINYTTTGGALTVLLNPAYICAGSDTPLSCTPGGGTGGAITYEWIAVNGDVTFDDPSAVQPKLAAATPPGVYKVKVKIKQGAQTVESAVVDITVGAQPKLATIGIFQNGNLIPDDGTSVLPGSKVSVVATGTNLPAGTVYDWTPTTLVESVSADQLTAESVALSRSASTCFKLTVTNADGKCPDYKEACVPVARYGIRTGYPGCFGMFRNAVECDFCRKYNRRCETVCPLYLDVCRSEFQFHRISRSSVYYSGCYDSGRHLYRASGS